MLLACTMFGLAVMHTFGHTSLTGPGHHAAAMAAAPGTQILAGTAALVAGDDAVPCDHDHCKGHGGHGAMSGWSVCMAILQGLAVALLLAVIVVALRRSRARRPHAATGVRLSRAPPRWPVGLALTTITVLRI